MLVFCDTPKNVKRNYPTSHMNVLGWMMGDPFLEINIRMKSHDRRHVKVGTDNIRKTGQRTNWRKEKEISPRLWYFILSGFLVLQNSTILLFPTFLYHPLLTIFHLLHTGAKHFVYSHGATRCLHVWCFPVVLPRAYLEVIILCSCVFSLGVRRCSELQRARVDVEAAVLCGERRRY